MRAVELEPDCHHSKYMYLGQLLTGQESVAAFLRGIELMKTSLVEQKEVRSLMPLLAPTVLRGEQLVVVHDLSSLSSIYRPGGFHV